jgi:hypothetical protein
MIERGVSDRPDGLTPAGARSLTAGREELLRYLTGTCPDSKCFR